MNYTLDIIHYTLDALCIMCISFEIYRIWILPNTLTNLPPVRSLYIILSISPLKYTEYEIHIMNSSLYIDQPPPCSVMSSLIGACSAYPAVGRDLTCGEESHQYQIYYIYCIYISNIKCMSELKKIQMGWDWNRLLKRWKWDWSSKFSWQGGVYFVFGHPPPTPHGQSRVRGLIKPSICSQ